MSFLAAAFLVGLATLAVPLLLHRRDERTPAETTVSSLMLMREADEPVRTRRVLAHRVLLALRLALLAALALAFAQPVLQAAVDPAAPGGASPARLVVLDSSFSMRREGVWEAALAAADALLDDDRSEHRLLLASDRLTFVADTDSAAPGWSRLDFSGLPGRLDAAIAGLAEPPGGWEVHLVSDFQGNAVPPGVNAVVDGARWPFVLHPVGGDADNWAVASVGFVGDRLELEIAGFAERGRNLGVALRRTDGDAERRATARVPARSRASVAFDVAPGRESTAWRVALDADDALAGDDVGYAVRAAADATTIAVLAANADQEALAFLAAALSASGFAEPVVLDGDGVWPSSLDVLIALDAGEPTASARRRLDRHLDRGRGMLLVAGPRTERAGSLPLPGLAPSDVRAIQAPLLGRSGSAYWRVVAGDDGHPLAQGAWDDVHVERALNLPATPDETILTLAPPAAEGGRGSAAPLLVERRVGKGRALVLLTALDRDWSSLVLRPAFVRLIGDAVRHLAQDVHLAAYAGEPVPLPAASAQILDAAGRRVLALDETAGRPVARLDVPGIYTVRTPGREAFMAVNVDPRESDLRPAPADFLARWQAAAKPSPAPVDAGATDAAPETEPLPLAPWLLALAALLLIAESLAANMGGVATSLLRRREASP